MSKKLMLQVSPSSGPKTANTPEPLTEVCMASSTMPIYYDPTTPPKAFWVHPEVTMSRVHSPESDNWIVVCRNCKVKKQFPNGPVAHVNIIARPGVLTRLFNEAVQPESMVSSDPEEEPPQQFQDLSKLEAVMGAVGLLKEFETLCTPTPHTTVARLVD